MQQAIPILSLNPKVDLYARIELTFETYWKRIQNSDHADYYRRAFDRKNEACQTLIKIAFGTTTVMATLFLSYISLKIINYKINLKYILVDNFHRVMVLFFQKCGVNHAKNLPSDRKDTE